MPSTTGSTSTEGPIVPPWQAVAPTSAETRSPDATEKQSKGKRGGCQFCSGRKFVRSGVRGRADLMAILLLRYPVRCRRCSERQYTDFLTASMALSAANRSMMHSKTRTTWETWTSGTDREVLDAWDKKRDD
ncbi:MAG TPA: hypothetical protein VGB94_01840 [Acidobacteriaceae bacterium]